MSELVTLLCELEGYFDKRADAEYQPGDSYPTGNEEMRLLVEIREQLKTESAVQLLIFAAEEARAALRCAAGTAAISGDETMAGTLHRTSRQLNHALTKLKP